MNQSLHTCLIAALCACTLTSTAYAQQATQQPQKPQPPADLQWQTMSIAAFDTKFPFQDTASADEREVAESIWKKELIAAKSIDKNDPISSFILIKPIVFNATLYIFSIYDRAGYEHCIPPANGRNAYDMYSTCNIRIVGIKKSGETKEFELANYCSLDVNDSQNPRIKNHTEVAIDKKSGIAHFRVIQYGKIVSECNRAIKL